MARKKDRPGHAFSADHLSPIRMADTLNPMIPFEKQTDKLPGSQRKDLFFYLTGPVRKSYNFPFVLLKGVFSYTLSYVPSDNLVIH